MRHATCAPAPRHDRAFPSLRTRVCCVRSRVGSLRCKLGARAVGAGEEPGAQGRLVRARQRAPRAGGRDRPGLPDFRRHGRNLHGCRRARRRWADAHRQGTDHARADLRRHGGGARDRRRRARPLVAHAASACRDTDLRHDARDQRGGDAPHRPHRLPHDRRLPRHADAEGGRQAWHARRQRRLPGPVHPAPQDLRDRGADRGRRRGRAADRPCPGTRRGRDAQGAWLRGGRRSACCGRSPTPCTSSPSAR